MKDLVHQSIPVKRAVKQVDVLSPLLFNICINDAVDMFNERDSDPPSLNISVIGCLLYADDLIILSTTADGLQKSFDKLHKCCQT